MQINNYLTAVKPINNVPHKGATGKKSRPCVKVYEYK